MSETALKPTPYERAGGETGVRALVNAFYDQVEFNPAYAALRAMHEGDLAPVREALVGFFSVWLGGPRTWLEQRGGFCIMSRHAKMDVTPETSAQWMDAFRAAVVEANVEAELAAKMDDALAQLAKAMSWTAKVKETP
jgi:hemoglobin